MHLLIGIFSKFHVALLWLMLCFADWPMGVEAKLQRAFNNNYLLVLFIILLLFSQWSTLKIKAE